MVHAVTLFSGSKIFGYILYKPGIIDPAVYGIAFKMLSAAITNSYNLTIAKEETKNAKLVSVTDELTGLMNRRGLLQFGQEAIEKCINSKKDGLVLFGDIDGLKKINDTFGHDAGDRAIKAEAELLKSVFCHKEIVGRLGGDEFAVIAPGMTQTKHKIRAAGPGQALRVLQQDLKGKLQAFHKHWLCPVQFKQQGHQAHSFTRRRRALQGKENKAQPVATSYFL